jgi:thioredoxin-related protein
MKKLVLFSLGVTLFFGCTAQPQNPSGVSVKWYTIEEAVALNEKKPKKIIIDIYTDWCSWCKVMDQNTFSQPEIAEYLNSRYYPVKFNAESLNPINYKGKVFVNNNQGRRSPHELAISLLQGKMSYPSIAFMDENSQPIFYLDENQNPRISLPGYKTPEQMLPLLVFFGEDHYKTTSWAEFTKTYSQKTSAK